MRRMLSVLLVSLALLGGALSLGGCVVVAPRHARVWVPGFWAPHHVWVEGHWRER